MGFMSIRDLNANVSRAIARVKAGETLDITSNGEVVAELRPKSRTRDAAWLAAHESTLEFLKRGIPLGGKKITAADKYDDADL